MKVEMEVETLGELLSLKMLQASYGVREAGRAMNISPATVSRISNGHSMALRHIIPVAQWCELTPQELWNFLEQYTKG